MLVYKIAQAHTFYDGLAVDVSEAVTQGSVIAILVIALILAIPSRGVIFGLGRKPSSELFAEMMQFAKKYHGYLVSFGTVTNFHYHPASHRNKSWILFLELWVFIHGSVTALIQPGSTWQIFSFGFLAVFLLNQVYWTRLAKHPFILATLYALYGIWVAWVFREDKKYFRIIFIPAAEYLCLGFTVAVGMLTAKVLRFIKSYHLKVIVTTVMYVLTGIAISVSLALILGGNIRVYNDY
ncbi:uncharacterized protein BYT42DRAFT_494138 [Radiomyces spectabilis]|uniref:uncharacterized protein n=1 Tax=Radiomyces spectabilis TaxID=64574 RepID=UPI00222096AB|nr:uncharacterized protein BYT42DRAFT_494138 [Radiomyces spectabilis]KAI8381020.1 hypothetical protein BYT42DRAFT_494138 [Radiomyces spectabilis]